MPGASRAALAILWVGMSAPRIAHAQDPEIDAEGRFSAGWDTNPAFAADPSQRAVPLEDEPPVDPSAVVRFDGDAAVRSGRAVYGEASFDADARLYLPSGDALAAEGLSLLGGLASPHGAVRADLRLQAGRYDASATPDASWSGGARVRLVWSPGQAHTWTLDLHGAGGVRRYDADGQLDATVGGGLGLRIRPATPIAFVMRGDAERRESTTAEATRTELSGGAVIELDTGPVEGSVEYDLYARDFDDGPRDGVEHVVRAGAAWWATRGLGLFVEAELGLARGQEMALVYDRIEALGGVALRFEPEPRPVVAFSAEAEDAVQGPAARVAGGIRFRVDRPGAHAVSVVGTFNHWDPSAGALRETTAGHFEATLPVRSGHHRYHFVVDGEPVVPDGAPRYVDDDFGGRDAVLLVP